MSVNYRRCELVKVNSVKLHNVSNSSCMVNTPSHFYCATQYGLIGKVAGQKRRQSGGSGAINDLCSSITLIEGCGDDAFLYANPEVRVTPVPLTGS